MKKIILASSSPRRKDILNKLGLSYEIIPSSYEEILDSPEFNYKKIERLAFEKAKCVADSIDYPALVIGADTVVVHNNMILGKPKDKAQAYEMLMMLNNNRHKVVTSLCVYNTENNDYKVVSTTSHVEFSNIDETEIASYIEKFNPLDKAGSYGIQELPPNFVKNVDGSFENIIGLCSDALKDTLSEF